MAFIIKQNHADRVARQPQKQHVQLKWREPDKNEAGYTTLHWGPLLKKEYSPKLSTSFAILFLALGILFGCSALVSLCINAALSIIFGLIAASFLILFNTAFKTNFQHRQDSINLERGKFVVISGVANNLDLISYVSEPVPINFAYVDVYSTEGILTVENVEIPFELGKVLGERGYTEFPCILIRIDGRKELIALPKFK